MQIEVLQENLVTALQVVHKVVPTKPQLASLSGILFTIDATSITLSATDLFIGIKTTVQGTVVKTGSAVIPAKTLLEILSSLPAGKVTLSVQEGLLTIKSSISKATLQCFSSEEFPAFPELAGQSRPLPFASLVSAVQTVGFATSQDPSRPVLTSLLFKPAEAGFQAIATDGFRLAVRTLSETTGFEQSVLLPAKALQEVVRIGTQFKVSEVLLNVDTALKQVKVTVQDTEIFIRLIEGEYPPYEKIIPAAFTTEAVIDAETLTAHIKRALIFSRDASSIVSLAFADNRLTVLGSSTTTGQYTGEIELESLTGPGGTIAFNARYVLDFLAAAKPEKVWFGMTESLKPAMFRIDGDHEYLYVVMPFRVNQ